MFRLLLIVILLPLTANAKVDPKELHCMKVALHHEARGEGVKGKQAVANVIMNRVRSRQFPNTICGVVFQRNRNGCQFSWYCDPRIGTRPVNVSDSTKRAAMNVLNNPNRDVTGGALWFHSGRLPHWASSKTETRRIGRHIFYR